MNTKRREAIDRLMPVLLGLCTDEQGCKSYAQVVECYLCSLGIRQPDGLFKNPYQIMWEEFWHEIKRLSDCFSFGRGYLETRKQELEQRYISKPKSTPWLRELGGF